MVCYARQLPFKHAFANHQPHQSLSTREDLHHRHPSTPPTDRPSPCHATHNRHHVTAAFVCQTRLSLTLRVCNNRHHRHRNPPLLPANPTPHPTIPHHRPLLVVSRISSDGDRYRWRCRHSRSLCQTLGKACRWVRWLPRRAPCFSRDPCPPL